MKIALMSAALIALASFPAHAQHEHSGHGATGAPGNAAPAIAAFQKAKETMHTAMTIPYTGDADVDFVRGMIAHHQGAIGMAKVVLSYGKNPQLKKLAQEIIAAQETEIAEMQDWMKKNAK